MKNFLRFVLSIVFASLALFARAAPPPTINYQGYLTGPTGTPTNTAVVMTFKLYNAASGGTLLYTELQPSVAVINGNFNAVIGAVSPIPLPFDVPYWLTVTINADPEMAPRQPLASSPYAFRATTADSVSSGATIAGSQITGTISPTNLPPCAANEIYKYNGSAWVCSGSFTFADQALALRSASSAFSTILRASSATSSRTIDFPDANGTVITSGNLAAITTVGTVASGIWNGSVIAASRGGIGIDTSATPAQSLLRTTGVGAWGTLPAGVDGQVLKMIGSVLAWGTDSTGSAGGGGTITSVAPGAGIVTTPPSGITVSGTVAIDTAVVPQLGAVNTFSQPQSIQNSGSAASVVFAVQGAAIQSGALQEWRNSAGSPVASVSSTGGFSGSGALLTGLNAGQLTSGNIPDTSLSANVSRLDLAQTRLFGLTFSDQTLDLRNSGNTFSTTLRASGATAPRTINFPDVTGSVITSGNLSDITSVGTVTGGTWNGVAIGAAHGGTGIDTTAAPAQSLLRKTNVGTWTTLSPGLVGQVLKVGASALTWANDNVATPGVTSVATGAGLSGGPITDSGTIALATTNLLPTTACATNQIPKWSGTAWACAADDNALPGGAAGQVLQGTAGAPVWTASPTFGGNLNLGASTAGAGNIVKDGFPFLHNYGGVNTFVGQSTGNFSLTGNFNTATGQGALNSITTGSKNTASGASALTLTNSGSRNAAFGVNALGNNSAGNDNTAIGTEAMLFNATGSANSAYGVGALSNNQTGSNNTAVGFQALSSPLSGTNNIGIGYQAGSNISGASSNNIYIGSSGNVGESNTIQIGTSGTHTATFISGIFNTSANGIAAYINAAGRFGTVFSSARYKDEIADMGNTSAGLMALRPVTFRYKPEHDDGARLLQYGLVAEEVAEVYPELVLMTAEGKAQTVRYQFLPPMLLNEFQKQQRTIVAQATELALQRGRMELLERELRNIKALLGVK